MYTLNSSVKRTCYPPAYTYTVRSLTGLIVPVGYCMWTIGNAPCMWTPRMINTIAQVLNGLSGLWHIVSLYLMRYTATSTELVCASDALGIKHIILSPLMTKYLAQKVFKSHLPHLRHRHTPYATLFTAGWLQCGQRLLTTFPAPSVITSMESAYSLCHFSNEFAPITWSFI